MSEDYKYKLREYLRNNDLPELVYHKVGKSNKYYLIYDEIEFSSSGKNKKEGEQKLAKKVLDYIQTGKTEFKKVEKKEKKSKLSPIAKEWKYEEIKKIKEIEKKESSRSPGSPEWKSLKIESPNPLSCISRSEMCSTMYDTYKKNVNPRNVVVT